MYKTLKNTHTHTQFKLIVEFDNVAGYKIKVQKSSVFLYTCTEQSKYEV